MNCTPPPVRTLASKRVTVILYQRAKLQLWRRLSGHSVLGPYYRLTG